LDKQYLTRLMLFGGRGKPLDFLVGLKQVKRKGLLV